MLESSLSEAGADCKNNFEAQIVDTLLIVGVQAPEPALKSF